MSKWPQLQGDEHAIAEVSPALIILCHYITMSFICNRCDSYTVFSSAPKPNERAA